MHCKQKSLYKNKLLITAIVIALLYLSSFIFDPMNNFRRVFNLYALQMGWAIALGLFVGGIINTFIPKTYVTKIMARKGHKQIINGVLMGFTMSVCSHGILAISIQLYKKGAAIPSLIAFLLSSPWANLSFTIMLFAFFGTWGALYIVTIAIIIALTTGYIFMLLDNKGLIEKNPNSMNPDKDFSIVKDIKDRFRKYSISYKNIKQHIKDIKNGVITLSNMVLWWILLGITLASLAGAFIPAHAFQQYMGPSAIGMSITLLLATILEVCAEGTAPLAFEIYHHTSALGNAFVFLMAGVATDYTEIGLLWYNIGRRTALLLPLITVPQIIFWGIIANMIF